MKDIDEMKVVVMNNWKILAAVAIVVALILGAMLGATN